MVMTYGCKYTIFPRQRNSLMSEGSINNCDVNNALC